MAGRCSPEGERWILSAQEVGQYIAVVRACTDCRAGEMIREPMRLDVLIQRRRGKATREAGLLLYSRMAVGPCDGILIAIGSVKLISMRWDSINGSNGGSRLPPLDRNVDFCL